jgi:hypothetical protein
LRRPRFEFSGAIDRSELWSLKPNSGLFNEVPPPSSIAGSKNRRPALVVFVSSQRLRGSVA